MASKARVSDFKVEGKQSPGLPWLGLGFLLSMAGAGFYFSHDSQFLLGQVASIVLGAFGLHGLCRGGFRKLVMLPLTVGSLMLMAAKPDFADPVVKAIAGQPSVLGNMLACGLTLAVTFLGAGAFVRNVRNRVILRRPVLLGTDRFVGTTVGLAEGGLVMLAVCWSAIVAQPQMARLKDHPGTAPGTGRYAVVNGMLQFVREIDESPMRSFIRDNNLLKDIPAVKSMMQQIEEASTNPDFWNGSPAEMLKRVDPEQLGELGNVVKELQGNDAKSESAN